MPAKLYRRELSQIPEQLSQIQGQLSQAAYPFNGCPTWQPGASVSQRAANIYRDTIRPNEDTDRYIERIARQLPGLDQETLNALRRTANDAQARKLGMR
jgi:hypothetical protein